MINFKNSLPLFRTIYFDIFFGDALLSDDSISPLAKHKQQNSRIMLHDHAWSPYWSFCPFCSGKIHCGNRRQYEVAWKNY